MPDTPPPTSEAWLLIDVGCAECRHSWDEPLVRILSVHESAEDAKLAADAVIGALDATWRPHPQGGEYSGFGSGDVWVAPLEAFVTPQTEAEWPAI